MSSLTFLSLFLVSGRRWILFSESTSWNMAETRAAVSATWEDEGALRLRITCLSRASTGIGRFGRSRGWSVIYLGELFSFNLGAFLLITHRKRSEVWKNFGILKNVQ